MIKQFIFFVLLISISQAFASLKINDPSKDRFDTARLAVLNSFINKDAKSSGNVILTVGADPACSTSSLAVAISGIPTNGGGEIRVATNTTYSNIIIPSNIDSLNLLGGYNNCSDAMNDVLGSDQAIINGTSGQTVVDSAIEYLNMSGFIIQNGGTGINLINASSINLKNMLIQNNTGTSYGGGLSTNNVSALFLHDVRIEDNTAQYAGGGIYSLFSNIVMVGESSLHNNKVEEIVNGPVVGGGGLYASEGNVTIVGGDNSFSGAGVTMNRSQEAGGGLLVTGTAGTSLFRPQLRLTGGLLEIDGITYGNLSKPLVLFDNRAGVNDTVGSGGGIFMTNRVEAYLTNVSFVANKAVSNGAGILASGVNSFLSIDRTSQTCWSQVACNYLGFNEAENVGGAVVVTAGAKAEIRAAQIVGNSADETTAVFVGGSGSDLVLTDSYISNNGGTSLNDVGVIKANNGGSLEIYHSTIVDNDSTNKVIDVVSSFATIENSIIYNPLSGPFITRTTDSNVITNCLILDETNNTSSNEITLINNTEYLNTFVNPTMNDYRLSDNSLAIDFCAVSDSPSIYDISQQLYGYDDPNVSEVNGFYDVGADESYSSDIIFMDGFED